ncbi:MAG TPA: beta-N-acetylglucosaminidase domain-containing protein [Candidatus Paceibacterota bacterium]|nr:beta-N-acetylglucosaminidase domain-containing protein [Verrucomicrobiota bacterium]HRY48810.1 beta-N-acetylglucosaminidase domain-containing protein [Candidatus Paceibacterota bacterium]
MQTQREFLAGVIEGFYGQPWSPRERLELFDWMTESGLNTYLYAPKDDLKQRAIWREPYSMSEAESLGELIRACRRLRLHFVYALSPGLDIEYGNPSEFECLKRRLEQMLGLGCGNIALLFDDIPDGLALENGGRGESLASAQCRVANALLLWFRDRCPEARFLFCPTPYCGRMAERKLGGEEYLSTLGRELSPEIDVFWTGPEIVSEQITAAHVRSIQAVLRRKPLIWDNLHANDYDGRRFFCGPYAGRPPELRDEVSGLLINPNSEFVLNYVPIQTLGEFLRCEGSWDSRKAYLSAMRKWWPCFATVGQPVKLEDLVLLGDCFYLPHAEGSEAKALYEHIRYLLDRNPAEWGVQAGLVRQQMVRLRDFCVQLTGLCHRPLFYALSRRVWELREELDLLEGFLRRASQGGMPNGGYHSDFHLSGTYRGGLVARLQQLLVQEPDGALNLARARPDPRAS